jgi:hypothetical protein
MRPLAYKLLMKTNRVVRNVLTLNELAQVVRFPYGLQYFVFTIKNRFSHMESGSFFPVLLTNS